MAPSIPKIKVPKSTPPKPTKAFRVADKFPQEVKTDTRRITGITSGLTRSFAASPWRYLSRSQGMKNLSGGGGSKQKGVI